MRQLVVSESSKSAFVTLREYSKELLLNPESSAQSLRQWGDAGFPLDRAPSLTECCAHISRAARSQSSFKKDVYGKEASERNVKACMTIVMSRLGSDPYAACLKIDTGVLATVTGHVALLGGRFVYAKEVAFLLKALDSDVDALGLPDIAYLVRGLRASDHHYEGLDRLESQAEKRIANDRRTRTVYLTRLITNLARLNYTPSRLLPGLQNADLPVLNTRSLVSLLWALCVIDELDCCIMPELWREISKRFPECLKSGPDSMQLHQAYLAFALDGKEDLLPSLFLSSQKGKVARRAAEITTYNLTTSGAQRDVQRCLETMGLEGKAEIIMNGMSVDLFVDDLNLAIELDGPTHFFRNKPDLPTAKTIFKRRLLRRQGLNVLSIPLEKWNSFADRSEQRNYIKRKIGN